MQQPVEDGRGDYGVARAKTFADDNDYFVWGLPFFNQQPVELRQFGEAVDELIRS